MPSAAPPARQRNRRPWHPPRARFISFRAIVPRVRAIAKAGRIALALCGAIAFAGPAWSGSTEEVLVTATALPGRDIDPSALDTQVQSFSAAALNAGGTPSLLRALSDGGAGVSLDEAQGNPFQPNLIYRGFEASPLSGDAQGIAVYFDGVRLNEPLGDSVNFDLIPDTAIARATLEAENPVYGLNALGGSLTLQSKTGFDVGGFSADVEGGSAGRADASFEYGTNDGTRAIYAALRGVRDDGWRDHSPSRLGQAFTDLAWKSEGNEIHLDLAVADSNLTGNGPAPVELLAVDRHAVFTVPDNTKNLSALANLYGARDFGGGFSLQANIYVSHLRQRTENGDASDAAPCNDGSGLLCLDDGEVLTDADGMAIADFLDGGPYAQLNTTATDSTGFGGTLQTAWETGGEHPNTLLAGAAVDIGDTAFAAATQLGALTTQRGFAGAGILIDQLDGSIAPVSAKMRNVYTGFYASDGLALTHALTLDLAARYNIADVRLRDRLGTALDGSHDYARLNPDIGIAYVLSPRMRLFASYGEANRAPTPAELACADASAPCSLTNFFVADPPLKQVVARSAQAGIKGHADIGQDAHLSWSLSAYRIRTAQDIFFVASALQGRAFFRNVGATRRQGVDATISYESGPLAIGLAYSHIDATFQSAATLESEDNPFADANGEIQIVPGDRMPGIPADQVKLTATYDLTPALSLAADARAASGQYLRGDESNLNPKTATYAVVDATLFYRFSGVWSVYLSADNLLGARYATFGTFSPTADVPLAQAPGASNPRSLTPGAPLQMFAGLRLRS